MIDKSILLDNKKFTLGVFDDPDKLLKAVKKLRAKGVKIFDCYTPFPVHHLDSALGYQRSNLTIGAFLCGMLGSLTGFSLAYYMNVVDWPMIIGGKPNSIKMFTSFIPVIFELTILFTAFGMTILFFIRSRMVHGIKEDLLDVRQTNDRLLIAIDTNEDQPIEVSDIKTMMEAEGAIEIRDKYEAFNTSHSDIMQSTGNPKQSGSASSTANKVAAPRQNVDTSYDPEKLDLIKSTLGTADASIKDNLQKIKGIGPKYEETLNSIGIYTYEQVSKLDADTINAVEELTNYFPGRIEREDWMSQARNLMN